VTLDDLLDDIQAEFSDPAGEDDDGPIDELHVAGNIVEGQITRRQIERVPQLGLCLPCEIEFRKPNGQDLDAALVI
jgi:hypothetical protein